MPSSRRCGLSSGSNSTKSVPSIKTVSVVGVGLIGGSFALALRQAGFGGRILGVSSESTLARALELGVIDEGCPLDQAVPQSDLVYLAQPVMRIAADLGRVCELAQDHALVTDAGSTKGLIVAQARELFRGGPDFLGGHPMAGKEGRGVGIADSDLFRGAVYALVPTGTELPRSPVAREFMELLAGIGCVVKVMDAVEHDRTVAWTSHLPQLVSTTLAAAIGKHLAGPADLEVAGDGLRDMTRLAASPHDVWAPILETNLEEIDEALEGFVREIEALRTSLRKDRGERQFQQGNALRFRMKS